MTAVTLSTDPESRDNYGPYVPNMGASCPSTGTPVRFNNAADLEHVLQTHGKNTAAFIVEPIQGEAGVVVPDDGYLAQVSDLCKKHNVLFICDEIQTGIGRTGRMLCSEWAGIKPDMVTLGKAISGGMYPVSAVLGSKEIMLVVEPGTHGSTYGGNPLGCAVSIRALELMEEEELTAKAERLGHIFRDGLQELKSPIIKTIRGMGLLNAIVIDEAAASGRTAWDLCILLMRKGLLVPTFSCPASLPFPCPWPLSPHLLDRSAGACILLIPSAGKTDAWRHHSICTAAGHHGGGAEERAGHHRRGDQGASDDGEKRGPLDEGSPGRRARGVGGMGTLGRAGAPRHAQRRAENPMTVSCSGLCVLQTCPVKQKIEP